MTIQSFPREAGRLAPSSDPMTLWLSMERRFAGLGILLAVLVLAGCGGPADKGAARGAGPAEEMEVTGELLTIEPVRWPTIARVQGSLYADEVATIAAKVFGRIVTVNCDLGDTVREGQQLIQLDDREYELRVAQAEAQLAQARAAVGLKGDEPVHTLDPMNSPPVRETKALLDEAQQQVSRLNSLFQQGAIVATDLEAAQSAEQVASARFNSSLNSVREKMALIDVQAAQLELAKQQLLDTVVSAPFDGMILSRSVAIGTYIQVGQPIVELARNKVLRYRASVPERLAQQLKIGQHVRLTIAGEVRETSVARISPSLDSLNRSLVFEADVLNEDNALRGGLFAQAEIVLDDHSTAIAIPSSALVRFAGVDKAWRLVDGKISAAALQVGRESDGMFEVLDGLSPGDQILLVGSSGRVGKYVSQGSQEKRSGAAATKTAGLVSTKTAAGAAEKKQVAPASTESSSGH